MNLPHIAAATVLLILSLGAGGSTVAQTRSDDACLELLDRSERLLSIDDPDTQELGSEKLRQAQTKCASQEVSPELQARALLLAARLYSDDRSRQLEMKREALSLLRAAAPDSGLLPQVLEAIADTQMILGNYDDALRVSGEALDERRRLFGAESREYVEGLVWMSVSHKSAAYGAADPTEHLSFALEYSERAVDLAERRFGSRDPSTIAARINLVDTLERQGRFDEAKRLYEEVAPYVDLIGDGR